MHEAIPPMSCSFAKSEADQVYTRPPGHLGLKYGFAESQRTSAFTFDWVDELAHSAV